MGRKKSSTKWFAPYIAAKWVEARAGVFRDGRGEEEGPASPSLPLPA